MRGPLLLSQLVSRLELCDESKALAEEQKDHVVVDVQDPELATEDSIVFLGSERLLSRLAGTKAKLLVINKNFCEKIPAEVLTQKICLKSHNAQLALAKVSELFQTEARPEAIVDPTAIIHKTAKLGKNISIAPYCVIGANTMVADNVVLHAGVKIGTNVKIGKDSILFPNITIYDWTQIGERVRIHANTVVGSDGFGYVQEKQNNGINHVKIHHMGKVLIGNDVEIGSSVTIDRGTVGDTVIGNGTKIDNQVQIGHNCQLDESVIICGCSALAGSVKVGKFSVLGGMVGVADHAVIGSGVMVAAATGLTTGHFPDRTIWYGYPPREKAEFYKLQAIYGKLPEIYEMMKEMKKATPKE